MLIYSVIILNNSSVNFMFRILVYLAVIEMSSSKQALLASLSTSFFGGYIYIYSFILEKISGSIFPLKHSKEI